MGHIIDRRRNFKGKSTGNKRKFVKRVEDKIRKALPKTISEGSIEDMATGKGKVKVPIKGIKEPKFRYDHNTGDKKYISPGNDQFQKGDKVNKPYGGRGQGGGGRQGSKDGLGEDEFYVELDREEFLKYFFENLELPDLLKKDLEELVEHKIKRKGHTKDSTPSRLNIPTSVKNSLARKIGIKSIYNKKIKELEDKIKNLTDKDLILELEEEIKKLKSLRDSIPFLDDVDLRYNNFELESEPSTNAVMFCIMDVSASMGEKEKTISKKFFTLLYMFLHKKYEKIELVFIRHHSEAKEVDEDEFFNSRESGGTQVVTALDLTRKIIKERYSSLKWNIYVTQASDGDVWDYQDASQTCDIIINDLLPNIRYYAYLEISRWQDRSKLYSYYTKIDDNFKNFSAQKVKDENEIWPVFQKLFSKKKKDA
jgi:hypothetical protein|tara:strand:+ start:476 stop:1747 length:1272 start_codon:yes stop_codon:yes gene_type:complete